MLRIRFLIFRCVGHLKRKTVNQVEVTSFPEPFWVFFALQTGQARSFRDRKELPVSSTSALRLISRNALASGSARFTIDAVAALILKL